jgi:hypothetical protein
MYQMNATVWLKPPRKYAVMIDNKVANQMLPLPQIIIRGFLGM